MHVIILKEHTHINDKLDYHLYLCYFNILKFHNYTLEPLLKDEVAPLVTYLTTSTRGETAGIYVYVCKSHYAYFHVR